MSVRSFARGRRVAFATLMLGALTGCQSPAAAPAAPQAAEPAPAAATPSTRHVMAVQLPPGPGLIPTRPYPSLYTDGRGQLHLVTSAANDWVIPGATRNLPGPIYNVAVSPSGRYIFYSSVGMVFVYDMRTARQFSVPFTGGLFNVRVFDVSADGRSLLFSSGGTLKRLDLRTGWSENFSLVPGFFDDARLGPNGNVVFMRNGRLESYNPTTGLLDTMPIANRYLYGF